MTVIIQTSTTEPNYEQTVTLDGRVVRFAFDWNARQRRWKVHIYDAASGDPIRLGMTLVDGWPVNRRVRDDRLPPRFFLALDPSGSHLDPGISDLGIGARSQLYAVPVDEVL